MLYDRVRYKIVYKGEIINILEPLEWDSVSKDFIRNETYHGMFVSLTDTITFIDDTRDLLIDIFNKSGVKADVIFIREDKNNDTDIWERDFTGKLDFMTINISKDKVSIKVSNEDRLTKLISKASAEVEIERITSLDDNIISGVAINKVYIEGRKLLQTGMLTKSDKYGQILGQCTNGRVWSPAFDETKQSDINDLVPVMEAESRTDINVGLQAEMFMGYNDSGFPLNLRVKVNWSSPFKVWYNNNRQLNNNIVTAKLRLAKFAGLLNNFVEEIVLWEWDGDGSEEYYIDIASIEYSITLGIEESLSLQWYIETPGHTLDVHVSMFDGYYWWPSIPGWEARPVTASIVVQNDSSTEPSNSNFILVHDFAEKMVSILTESKFSSKLLGRASNGYELDGKFSAIGILHGLWLRGIDANLDVYKPLSITWKDFYESLNTMYPVGLSLEGDTFVLEDRTEFYRNVDTIDLGEVSNLVITVVEKDYYSLIDIGSEKAGGYKEKQGLNDPNRKTQYATTLNTTNTLKLLSKIRSDSYGLESVRRETEDLTSDTSFDDDKWWLELIEVVGANWKMAGWEDKFEEVPKNIYSPETMMNTWLSPINIILRHGKWLRPPLKQYGDSKILYTFSEGNSSMVTKLIGGIEYAQNDGVPVNDLDYPVHSEVTGTFTAPITFKTLNNRTNGKRDIYGVIKFVFRNKIYRGFAKSIKIKDDIGEFVIKILN